MAFENIDRTIEKNGLNNNRDGFKQINSPWFYSWVIAFEKALLQGELDNVYNALVEDMKESTFNRNSESIFLYQLLCIANQKHKWFKTTPDREHALIKIEELLEDDEFETQCLSEVSQSPNSLRPLKKMFKKAIDLENQADVEFDPSKLNFYSRASFQSPLHPKTQELAEKKPAIDSTIQKTEIDSTVKMFKFFKMMANQPSTEMTPRYYMANKNMIDRELTRRSDRIIENSFFNIDHRPCGSTMQILQDTMFTCNPSSLTLTKYEFSPSPEQEKQQDLFSVINKNGDELKMMPNNSFYAYFIAVSTADNFNSHCYTAIQHIDNDSNVSFAVFQSYISKPGSYTLGEYLDKNNYIYSDNKFNELLKFTFSLMEFEKWTEESANEYESYFCVKEYKPNQVNLFSRKDSKCHFSFGSATTQQIVSNIEEFEKFKLENPVAQKFGASF